MKFRLITAARKATYTEKNIQNAFEATGIWPLNSRRVLGSRARSVASSHGGLPASVTTISATPHHTRAVYRLQRNVVSLISRDTPRSHEAKILVRQLGKVAEGSLAESILKDEMIKTIRLNLKGPSAKTLKDRRTLTKARVIDQQEVVALREAQNARDAKKLKKVARQQKLHSVASSSSTIPATPLKRSQKSVDISEKVIVDLVSPEGIFSEDGWGTDLEEALENEASEEEFIDIEEILGPNTSTNGQNRLKINPV